MQNGYKPIIATFHYQRKKSKTKVCLSLSTLRHIEQNVRFIIDKNKNNRFSNPHRIFQPLIARLVKLLTTNQKHHILSEIIKQTKWSITTKTFIPESIITQKTIIISLFSHFLIIYQTNDKNQSKTQQIKSCYVKCKLK